MRPFLAGLLLIAAIVLAAPPAASAQDATGPCSANATISNGVFVNPYDPAQEGTVYEMPIEGSASYDGSINQSVPTPREISGSVKISGPPGFGDITLDDEWVWGEPDATSVAKQGDVSWKLPKTLPRGVELEVVGVHRDANGVVCEGKILVTLAGGFFDSPVSYVAIGGTVLAAIGLVAAMFASGGAPAAPLTKPPPAQPPPPTGAPYPQQQPPAQPPPPTGAPYPQQQPPAQPPPPTGAPYPQQQPPGQPPGAAT